MKFERNDGQDSQAYIIFINKQDKRFKKTKDPASMINKEGQKNLNSVYNIKIYGKISTKFRNKEDKQEFKKRSI
jgi:hypothetical protein